jgi:transposase InsO family protein
MALENEDRKEFLAQHWESIVAADFFTVEVWTPRGLQRFLILFFIDLSTRRVEIAGIAPAVNGLWMSQIGRKVTDAVDGIVNGKRYLIHDRDPLFTTEFQSMLADMGVQSVKLPPRSPNLNAYAERFVRSIKESCLDRMIFFGETSLWNAVSHFIVHYRCASFCPPRYVFDKSRRPCSDTANMGLRVFLRTRLINCAA